MPALSIPDPSPRRGGALLWFAAVTSRDAPMPTPTARPVERLESDPARAARDDRLAALLAAAARGDCTAFEAFYDATFTYARTIARRMLSGSDVDDLLADAYFEAWRSVARYDAGRGSAMTWLLTLVRSRCLDVLRQRRTQPSVGGSDDTPPSADDIADDDAEDPAQQLWRQQADARLHAALAALSAAERWVLGLAYFRELSHTQIAAATGMPLGTVKTHLLRAQQRLRALLAPLT